MGSINIFKRLSTFLQAVPLINLGDIDSFFLLKKFWRLGIAPGQLGLKASVLTIVLCCPPLGQLCLEPAVWLG